MIKVSGVTRCEETSLEREAVSKVALLLKVTGQMRWHSGGHSAAIFDSGVILCQITQ